MGKQKKLKDMVHVGFEIGLLVKGIDGILEIILSVLDIIMVGLTVLEYGKVRGQRKIQQQSS